MTAPRPRPNRPRHALIDEPEPEPAVVEAPTDPPPPPRCNLDGCRRDPEWRGLCAAHRQTHRALADPKEPR